MQVRTVMSRASEKKEEKVLIVLYKHLNRAIYTAQYIRMYIP